MVHISDIRHQNSNSLVSFSILFIHFLTFFYCFLSNLEQMGIVNIKSLISKTSKFLLALEVPIKMTILSVE